MSNLRSQFQRPEGALLERTRMAKRPIMPVRIACARAGVSDATWRAYTNGYRFLSPGDPIEMIAPAATLSRMAAAVGLTPADLESAGRADAAFILAGGSPDDLDPTLIPKPSVNHAPKPFVPDPALELIESRRRNANPTISIRKAAAAARISYTQWRNLTIGMPRLGRRVQTRATDAVVARMAQAVNINPEDIAARGRPTAAALMTAAEAEFDAAETLEQHWAKLAREQHVNAEELNQLSADIYTAVNLLSVYLHKQDGHQALISRLLDGEHRLRRIADYLEGLESTRTGLEAGIRLHA